MKKVFIIHGFGGVPNGGWFPWLMGKLAKENIFACSLPMPNPANPVASEWINTMQSYLEANEEIILVGHSLGGTAVLRYLESLNSGVKIGGVVLVAPVSEKLEVADPTSDFRKIDNFFNSEFDLEKIKNAVNKITIIHGKKDQFVPFEHSEKISKGLGCELITVENGDHFSQKSEPICYELPQALDSILKIAK